MPDLPRLTVRTLGAFAVARGATPLGESAWGREKALELFQYFLTHPAEVVRKERLGEELWPELSGAQAERAFKVAFNALNDALEPERPARTLAGYLQRQGSSYGLNPEAPIELDYLLFEREVLAASRQPERSASTALYRQALGRYLGDYLPDRLAKDWSAPTRERLQGLYLTSATELARRLGEDGDTLESRLWCQRVVSLDPLWEEAYRLLMRAHLAEGNRPQAVRVYRALEDRLKADLDLEPMRETKRLYEQALTESSG